MGQYAGMAKYCVYVPIYGYHSLQTGEKDIVPAFVGAVFPCDFSESLLPL
jgi:hypothetical protein